MLWMYNPPHNAIAEFHAQGCLEQKGLVSPVRPCGDQRSLCYPFCAKEGPCVFSWPEPRDPASLLASLPLLYLTLTQQRQDRLLLSWYPGLVSRLLDCSGGRAREVGKECTLSVWVSQVLTTALPTQSLGTDLTSILLCFHSHEQSSCHRQSCSRGGSCPVCHPLLHSAAWFTVSSFSGSSFPPPVICFL